MVRIIITLDTSQITSLENFPAEPRQLGHTRVCSPSRWSIRYTSYRCSNHIGGTHVVATSRVRRTPLNVRPCQSLLIQHPISRLIGRPSGIGDTSEIIVVTTAMPSVRW